ncbi:MAG: lamin tail domain-containing protein [Sedimentisphaerales bacterium]|nr:lamin tail domain-containing protein [Sedimentisphaerales bacterium]
MNKEKSNQLFWVLVYLLIGVSITPAAIFKLDVNDKDFNTPAETEAGFTPIAMGSDNQTAQATIGGMTVTIISDTNASNQRRRTTPTGIPYEQIYRDFIFGRVDGLKITLTGLEANTVYRLTMYSFDSGSTANPPREAIWTSNGSYLFTTAFNGAILPTGADDYAHTGLMTADENGQIVLQSTKGPNTPETETIYSFINALILENTDSCYNAAPQIQAPDTMVAQVNKSVPMDITVTDDGRPYEEGCDPANPSVGDPYGLVYQWVQTSGPAPITFSPTSADIKDITAVFTLPGTYELKVQVSDGPWVGGPADAKMSEHTITIHVPEPLYGDINGDGRVGLEDLQIFADQWLSISDCLQLEFCADLDVSGNVGEKDFAMLSRNWLIDQVRVVINEFAASSHLSFPDGDGNSSDWIELFNPDTEPVSLAGWYLTDDPDNLRMWPFPPQTVLNGEQYMVVFASDQPVDNYVDAKGYLHTSFALERDGEYLALVSPDGRIAHEYRPAYPLQETDISYGMWLNTPHYFALPTPGAANQQAFTGFADKTSHSYKRGFYTQPFDLQIISDTPGVVIHYTLDGSEPDEQNGLLYDPNVPVLITTTSTVRSVAFKPGYHSSRVTTHTYIFVDDVAGQPSNPSGWPADWGYSSDAGAMVPADYEMDPRVVQNTLPGYSVQEALLDIPTVTISMKPEEFISDTSGIYANPLDRWERKCSLEYILPDGVDGFQEDCKIEVHGNASRRPARMQKHSLRLTFTSLYGSSKLKYPLFPGLDVEEFNQLVLRACFTDSWGLVSWAPTRYRPNDSMYIRDAWMKQSLTDMGQPSSTGSFVHLYVNGLYFGLYNLSERLAPDFFADHLGGNKDDWQINEDFATPPARWNTMMSIDPSTAAGYAQMQNYLDVENFADYILLHLYADSEDWPQHNGYAAANPVSGDGKFRFFVWDQEIVLDYHGRAAERINSTGGVGSLFQKMRTSDEFRLLFADRVYRQCFNDGALSQSASQERFLGLANRIDKAIVAESARWGDTQMKTPYGNVIEQPSPLDNYNHQNYPAAPHGPDYYFTREDSWLVERDNVINHYIPDIHNTGNAYALIHLLRANGLYPAIDPPVFLINGIARHGGTIASTDILAMNNPNGAGTIYYTVDGNDPRAPGISLPGSDIVLVPESNPKTVWIGSVPDSAWTGGSEPFDDSSWTHGVYVDGKTGGVGYDTGSQYLPWISYNVINQMLNTSMYAYVRIPFTADTAELAGVSFLKLRMRYDDGFAAYLNGQEIARSPGVTENPWATTSHETASFEEFSVTQHLGKIKDGQNILAILGINANTTSTDFIVSAELVAGVDNTIPPDVAPTARVYTTAEQLAYSARIKARVRNDGIWSALHEAVFAVGSVRENLRITELMYHPSDPNEEFLELLNIGDQTINLNLVRFDQGINVQFSPVGVAPGQYILLVCNEQQFRQRYPDFTGTIAAEYSGSLDNAGEMLRLLDALGNPIQEFDFKDSWYPVTDGEGFSLTIRNPYETDMSLWNSKAGWRPSAMAGGSPGYDDSNILPPPGSIVINEVLAHSHSNSPDWIELYNTTDMPIHIGGWYLSDDDSEANRTKYQIEEGTILGGHEYLVFYEDSHFGPEATGPGIRHVPFSLSEGGELVHLQSAAEGVLTGYVAVEDFGASVTGVSFGRYEKASLSGGYDFVLMASSTGNQANSGPLVGPVIMTEIMYRPGSTNAGGEFIELHNLTDQPLVLQDWVSTQLSADPLNITTELVPWRFTNGIDFTFPMDTTIPAKGYVVVAENPADFAAWYGALTVQVLGPFENDSKLNNDGERVTLSRPADKEWQKDRYYIRVDSIEYNDAAPWPTGADGTGTSLQHKNPDATDTGLLYSNDPANWYDGPADPGQ